MSDTWDHPDDEGSDLVKQLRKQLDAANKKLKQFADTERTKSVDKVLAKLPDSKREKAKRLIGENDPEEWLEEYGELFGATETPTAPTTPVDEPPVDAGVADRISQAVSGAEPPTRVDNLRNAFQSAPDTEQGSIDAFAAELAKFGNARVTEY